MKKTKLILLLLALVVVITGCTQYPTGHTTTSSKETLTIGIMAPLSGPTARYGEAMNAGYKLALQDIRENVKYKDLRFRVVYEDSKCNNKDATTAVTKLINVNNADIILGPYCTGPNVMASQIAAQHNKLVLSPSGVSRDHVGLGETFFRLQPESTKELETLVKYIFKKGGYQTFAILYLNNDFGYEYRDVFEQEVSKRGGKIILKEGYDLSAKDFRTTIAKIQQKQPDAIFIVSSDFHQALMVKQFREMNIALPVYSTVNTQSVKTTLIAGGAANGVTYAFNDDINLQQNQKAFLEKLYASGYELSGFAEANSYDALTLAVEALDRCGSETNCQRQYLRSLKNYVGVSGLIDFTSGDIEKPMIVKKIKGEKFVIAK